MSIQQRQVRTAIALALLVSPLAPVDTRADAVTGAIAGPSIAGATAVPTWAEESVVTWGDVGAGELLWKSPFGLVPLPVVDTDVEVLAAGIVAEGTIRQRFHNPTEHVIEAIYVFPLPETAAVQHMELRIGDRRIVSVVEERAVAKRTYDEAKAEGRKAALIEEERPNLFTTAVANIDPGLSVDVTLTYVDEIPFDDGGFTLVFPLTFTPRFVPEATRSLSEATGAPLVTSSVVDDADRVTPPFVRTSDPRAPRARVRLSITPGVPVREVSCLSHDLVAQPSGASWRFDTGPDPVVADRDVRVRWRPDVGREPVRTVLTETRGNYRHALVMLVPPALEALAVGDGLGATTTFVVDVSGSMAGPSIEQAREALLGAIDRLEARDRFAIVAFATQTAVFRPEIVDVTPEAKRLARAFVRGLEANGGTNMFPALLRAVSMFDAAASEASGVRRIVFLTDGAIGNESQMLERVARGLGDVRLHVIGIGAAPNRHLVRQMASKGRGLATFVAGAGSSNEIDRFMTRIDRPVLTDISLSWEGVGLVEVYPEVCPDLHAGEPLFVSARIDASLAPGGAERLVIHGRTRDGELRCPIDLPSGGDARGVAARWARTKVSALTDRGLTGADADSVRRAIVDVGIAYHLVTPYTSLVAVEQVVTSLEPSRGVALANALPVGSQLLGPANGTLPRGGTDRPLRREVAAFLIRTAILLLGARALLGGRREVA